jgi:membrane fusion protein (multidrug efflux system)
MIPGKIALPALIVATALLLMASSALAQGDTFDSSTTSTGIVVADKAVTLSAKISGRIATVNVEEGDRVEAGAVLVDIEDAQERANLAAAQALLRQEQVRMEHNQRLDARFSQLLEQNSVSQDRADEARFNFEIAQAAVERARAEVRRSEVMLAETKILAPFPGVITMKDAEAGKVTSPGEPLLRLEDQRTLKFRTRVNERDIAGFSPGQELVVIIDALGDLTLAGPISKIIPSGDESTHDFTIEITLPPQDRLYPGMFGRVEY